MGDIEVGAKEQEDKVAEGAYIKVLFFEPFILAAVKEILKRIVLATLRGTDINWLKLIVVVSVVQRVNVLQIAGLNDLVF